MRFPKRIQFALLIAAAILSVRAGITEEGSPIKFLISVEQPAITAPFPARLTLFLHNSSHETLWLYRHAGDPDAMKRIEGRQAPSDEVAGSTATHSIGGATLVVQLTPAEGGVSTPARAAALERVDMPHPRLVRLDPGEDYEEKAVVQLTPASGTGGNALWGRYRVSAVYGASYSNGDSISQNLGVRIWQGEVSSNAIEIDYKAPSGQGSESGTTVSSAMKPTSEVLVSLSDADQHALEQQLSGPDGRFSFDHLPPGTYWLTARRDTMTMDTSVVRHVDLTASDPNTSVQLPLVSPEVYEPKQMLHKPVLFRVLDLTGQPAGDVELEATWSSGDVLDNVKGRTAPDGTVALEVIPGRSYVGLKRRGCKKSEDLRADVATGDGIDGFKFVLECK